ncbi:MAG TPA: hypothetical protein ENF18_05590 [candidate division WOR-3 bacterium]|uniref:Dihydroorotate dehydrogenase electron transfer subunit iron-sulphur cluster binding domain-containing protein n=1 Tax=candidate division WOR-3 bacterium TaxID=2052148 RepID=A0A7C0ZIG9_UNCW3|nr:hypothetical protein [candidate division WOR-3 bacterium]
MKYRRIQPIVKQQNKGLVKVEFKWDGEPPMPGQFFMLTLERLDIFLPRPFSVFDFQNGVLSFLIKPIGRFTNLIMDTDDFHIMGPLGNPAPFATSGIFVGGGIGVAPLHFHAKQTENFIFIAGSLTDDLRFFISDLEKRGRVIYTTEDGSYGVKGLATEPLEEILKEKREIPVFACGPVPMLEKVKEITGGRNTYLYMEQVMGCGTGGCKGCAIKTTDGYKMVCSDGPVFNAVEVIFE